MHVDLYVRVLLINYKTSKNKLAYRHSLSVVSGRSREAFQNFSTISSKVMIRYNFVIHVALQNAVFLLCLLLGVCTIQLTVKPGKVQTESFI